MIDTIRSSYAMARRACRGLWAALPALLALCAWPPPSAAAQAAYPDRPIRVVVPWPAGGSGDLVGRVFGDLLAKQLGATVVVENRSGANAIIGANLVAKAEPDGYTVLVTTSEPITINPGRYTSLPYDVEKELEPLALIARTHFVIAANKNFPADGIQAAIALAKQRPGDYTVASYGIADMFLAYFESATGTRFLRVPYQGAAPAMAATLGGTADLTFVASSTALATGGGVKVLGVGSAEPIAALPGVSTFIEQDMPGFQIGNWIAVFAPHGLAGPARDALAPAIEAVARSEAFRTRLQGAGIESDHVGADALRTMIREDTARWKQLAAERGLKLD